MGLPAEGIAITTNERGEFDFPELAQGGLDLVCAAVGYLPASEENVKLAGASTARLKWSYRSRKSFIRWLRFMKRQALSPWNTHLPRAT